jgi:protein phosphatase 2C family protein 2/3
MKVKEAIMGRLGQDMPTTIKQPKRKPSEEKSTRPQLEDTRVMNKRNGCIGGYSANTYHGLVRSYNEDRVSIILNITRPESLEKWPKCSYFAVFDGHGGSLCSDFLRDNMHKFVLFHPNQIIEDRNFPFKPVDALKNGFAKAESEFKKLA